MKRIVSIMICVVLVSCMHGPSPNKPPDYQKSYGLDLDDLAHATPSEVDIIYNDAVKVPMVRVLADPAKYDGKSITIHGVLAHEFEETAVYLDLKSYEYGFPENAIYILSNYTREELLNEMAGNYVSITGVYEAEPASRLFQISGHLHHVAPMTRANIKLPNRKAHPIE